MSSRESSPEPKKAPKPKYRGRRGGSIKPATDTPIDPLAFFNKSSTILSSIIAEEKSPKKKAETKSKITPTKRSASDEPIPGKKTTDIPIWNEDEESSDDGGPSARERNAAASRRRSIPSSQSSSSSPSSPSSPSSSSSFSSSKANLPPRIAESTQASARLRTPPRVTKTQKSPVPSSNNNAITLDSDSSPEVTPSNPSSSLPPKYSRTRSGNTITPAPANAITLSSAPTSPSPSSPSVDAEDDFFASLEAEARATAASASQPANQSPPVTIFITSPLPETAPTFIKIRLATNLNKILTAYTSFNPTLDPNSVFLLWRGIKLWDGANLSGLGVELDADGELVDGQKGIEGVWVDWEDDDVVVGEGEGRRRVVVRMEVVDERVVVQREREEEERRRRAETSVDQDEDEEEEDEDSGPKMSVRMKVKGKKDDFVVEVAKNAPIEKLLGMFREHFEVPGEKKVEMMFEGDKVDPEGTLDDLDIEEEDMEDEVAVEMYIR